MTGWLYEAGIGEARAALVDGDRLVAARIELPGLRVGDVADGRLVAKGLVRLADGTELLLDGAAGTSVGGAVRVAVTRALIPEPGRAKRARCRVSDAAVGRGPDLLARITASGIAVRECRAHEADALEAAGWSEVLDEAMMGEIGFPGGVLRMSPTPAMTLFDVDGEGPLEPLAEAAATAIAHAIVRHDIGGSIGIDFPSIQGRGPRAAVAAAIDAALPPPFERTALNGFGFLQIIRRRARASLPELLRADPAGAATRALLRHWERTPPGQTGVHRPPPAVKAVLATHPDWRAELTRRTGGAVQVED